MNEIQRLIRWFDKRTDELVGEEPLGDVDVAELHRLFHNASNDPRMVLCYPITNRELPHLQPHVDHPIRLDLYAYYVEADAASVPEPAGRS